MFCKIKSTHIKNLKCTPCQGQLNKFITIVIGDNGAVIALNDEMFKTQEYKTLYDTLFGLENKIIFKQRN